MASALASVLALSSLLKSDEKSSRRIQNAMYLG
jgi:hypothetical protein